MRNSALASAALTSVALLAQTANAAPSVGDETPSREEVSRRVSSLYDRAESDTGTFNATRAAATGPRKRAERPTGAAGTPAAVRGDEGRRGDPALDDAARQWFDAVRSKLGPTVPAALPAGRMPERPAETPRTRPAERAGDGLADRGREASGRAALELPAAPVAELTSAPATGTAPVAELTAGPIAALPAAPEAPQETTQTGWSTRSALAPPAPVAETAAEPQQRSALRAAKEQNQRKLARAREVLSVYTAQQGTPLAAVEALPAADTWSGTAPQVQPSAEAQWQALRAQSAADLTTVPPGTTAWPTTTSQALDRSTPLTSAAPQDTRAVRALAFARAQIGKPCVWGTTGPDAYDGPGLTQAAWKAAGITLPRTAPEQATAGQGIALTYLEPGDLVLFHIGHVGIYSGNGMMIHAPGPGAAIREESIHYAGESAIHSAIRPA
ncbi:NlpC/P60 family protein [Streptomyces sp. DT2A-34]|uniref:C40 family peptidase n=1 Tax=Streptomyces sp. DT2A-34 TaxID=3051182 RepID=UPI00265C845B|nr:NlpC/P60 family protein [Streptomyces sp. DT2A-34]MDO0917062.1 NlpC/P60 family protein [Streptomyces sp. DT2A-34]